MISVGLREGREEGRGGRVKEGGRENGGGGKEGEGRKRQGQSEGGMEGVYFFFPPFPHSPSSHKQTSRSSANFYSRGCTLTWFLHR